MIISGFEFSKYSTSIIREISKGRDRLFKKIDNLWSVWWNKIREQKINNLHRRGINRHVRDLKDNKTILYYDGFMIINLKT